MGYTNSTIQHMDNVAGAAGNRIIEPMFADKISLIPADHLLKLPLYGKPSDDLFSPLVQFFAVVTASFFSAFLMLDSVCPPFPNLKHAFLCPLILTPTDIRRIPAGS